MNADLHTHTNASDGTLTPMQLVEAAARQNVELLAITDHDTTAAYRQLGPLPGGLRLVTGIELSSQWGRLPVHIVGLNFDLDNPVIRHAEDHQARIRADRADRIAARLEKAGLSNALQGAREQAADGVLGRPHFARFMVTCGFVRNEAEAFKKYLGQGAPCDIACAWPAIDEVVAWIRTANGTAVLAHPGKYRLTRTRLASLVADFASDGGQALEVVSGRQPAPQSGEFAKLAAANRLLLSCGSDFHQPGQSWAALGACSPAPAHPAPVWENW